MPWEPLGLPKPEAQLPSRAALDMAPPIDFRKTIFLAINLPELASEVIILEI